MRKHSLKETQVITVSVKEIDLISILYEEVGGSSSTTKIISSVLFNAKL